MNDACYVSSVDKIFGTVGPYVCKYNATTGAREGFVKVGAPLYGDMRICYHAATGSLYVATMFQPNDQYDPGFFPAYDSPFREVFPVSTALAVGAILGLGTVYENVSPYGGFQWIGSSGNYLYIAVSFPGKSGTTGWGPVRINPTNLADRNSSTTSPRFRSEQVALSPTQIAVPNPVSPANNCQIRFASINFNLPGDWDSMYVVPYNPCAAEYCASNGLFYAVCGNTNLLRIDTLTPFPGSFTALNLGPVEASADPCRIRYRTSDQKLYLPCMTANAIIVWDPASETGVLKSGFDSPCDVIFSGSKAWAVQQSPIGLKEII